MQWPTLNSAKTKVRGTIKGDDTTHEEYEVIQATCCLWNTSLIFIFFKGVDDVVVPAKYSGKVSGTSLTGKLETDDDDLKCTYKSDKIDTPPSRGKEARLHLLLLKDVN